MLLEHDSSPLHHIWPLLTWLEVIVDVSKEDLPSPSIPRVSKKVLGTRVAVRLSIGTVHAQKKKKKKRRNEYAKH